MEQLQDRARPTSASCHLSTGGGRGRRSGKKNWREGECEEKKREGVKESSIKKNRL